MAWTPQPAPAVFDPPLQEQMAAPRVQQAPVTAKQAARARDMALRNAVFPLCRTRPLTQEQRAARQATQQAKRAAANSAMRAPETA
jgi:hypothetical protein